eukprot:COSAG01_NODE_29367_length_639_cov_1.635185_2_plen_63_part_01
MLLASNLSVGLPLIRGHMTSRHARRGLRLLRMTDLVKHDSRSLDKINTREAGLRVLTNDISIG